MEAKRITFAILFGCYIVDIISDEKQIKIRSVALIEATGNSTKLICGYSIQVSSTTINYQFFLTFRKVLSYRKKERSLLSINILETLPVM